jgi:4-oxalocrotonate tautomerase
VVSAVVDKPNTLLIVRNWYHFMPIVSVAMYSGRTQREKDRFAEAITEDAVKILGVKREDVIIVFQEAPHGNWYASGVRL